MIDQGLLEAVHFYRQLGFFDGRASLVDAELATALNKEYREKRQQSGIPEDKIFPLWEPVNEDAADPDLRPSNRNLPDWWGDIHPDLKLLSLDEPRIWWDDLETDYYPEGDNFVEMLGQWSSVSLGAFLPADIEEYWPEDGVMYLEFNLGEQRHRIVPWETMPNSPREGFGWTDIGMVNEINKIIENTGYIFCVADAFDQTAFLFIVRQEEKEKLIQERGWKFLESEDEC